MLRRSFVKGLAAVPIVGALSQLPAASAAAPEKKPDIKNRPQIVSRWACGCSESEDAESSRLGECSIALTIQTEACDQNPSICDEQSGRPPISVTEE